MTHFHGIDIALRIFRDELQGDILRNSVPDGDGECPNLSAEALKRAQQVLDVTGAVSELVRSLNKLYGHDHSEAPFIAAHDEQIQRLKALLGVKV